MHTSTSFLALACVGLLGSTAAANEERDKPCRPCHFYGAMEGAPQIDPAAYERSPHAQEGCINCHLDIQNPDIEHEKVDQDLEPVRCGDCHSAARAAHEASVHGPAHARSTGLDESVSCSDCHGVHDVMPSSDPSSRTNRNNIAETCASCHADGDRMANGSAAVKMMAAAAADVHASADPESGDGVRATCIDCHGAHDTLPGYHPRSRIHRDNIEKTCEGCHEDASAAFARSVHAKLVREHDHKGASGTHDCDDIPICTDCHAGHGMTRAEGATFRASLHMRCARCHGDEAHMRKHGMDTTAMTSYLDDFHGMTNELYAAGSRKPAASVGTCTDCHGAHEIQSFEGMPKKEVRERMAQVCRTCHQEVPDGFADAWLSHEPSFASAPLVVGIKWGYRIAIPLIVFGLLAHIGVHFYAAQTRRKREEDES